MDDKKTTLTIILEYPGPELTPEEKRELEERLKSTMTHHFPELCARGEILVLERPKANGHKK